MTASGRIGPPSLPSRRASSARRSRHALTLRRRGSPHVPSAASDGERLGRSQASSTASRNARASATSPSSVGKFRPMTSGSMATWMSWVLGLDQPVRVGDHPAERGADGQDHIRIAQRGVRVVARVPADAAECEIVRLRRCCPCPQLLVATGIAEPLGDAAKGVVGTRMVDAVAGQDDRPTGTASGPRTTASASACARRRSSERQLA